MRDARSVAPLVAFAVASIVSCKAAPPPADVPPLTVARPTQTPVISEGAASDAGAVDASASTAPEPRAAFFDAPETLEETSCGELVVVAARGTLSVLGETLSAGDLLAVTDPAGRVEITGAGLGVRIAVDAPCGPPAKRATKHVVRAATTPELRWAGGAMSAHLDTHGKGLTHLYVGRLEGTAPVAEHVHPTSYEVVAAIEASGTFVLDGKEARLGPRQIVMVPPSTKHAWRPDPGAKLVAIQAYAPPGPEERFRALSAQAADGGAPPLAREPSRDAGAPRDAGAAVTRDAGVRR